jgi:NADPH:quinone reductase
MRALLPTWRPAPLVAFGEAAQPEPASGEALVKVAAFSVNRGETFQLEGLPRPGWRPGKDIAGLVVQAAAGGPPIGSRVVGHPPQAGWAEYAAVPADSLAELPSAVPDTIGAALPLAGLTALRLLRAAGPVIGRRILLTGASGGVGHYLTELAAAAGGEVTAVTASTERGSRLHALGATQIVNDVTAAAGHYDLVLESTGGESLPAAMSKLADRGTAIWFGQASKTPPTLDFFGFLSGPGSMTLRIFHYADSGLSFRDDLTTLVRLTATGRLHPEVGLTTGWQDTADVLVRLRDRGIRGNAVLTI